ncbi:hypothetical protein Pfo_004962, partial [Paulownia fortunei]
KKTHLVPIPPSLSLLYIYISVKKTELKIPNEKGEKTERTQMESSLTQLEMDAVLQLIHLSGNSAHDFQVFWVNFPGEKDEVREEIRQEEEEEENREESVGETSLSSVINPEKLSEEEALPRRRKKLRPIADIYRKTQPLIKNLGHKRPKI